MSYAYRNPVRRREDGPRMVQGKSGARPRSGVFSGSVFVGTRLLAMLMLLMLTGASFAQSFDLGGQTCVQKYALYDYFSNGVYQFSAWEPDGIECYSNSSGSGSSWGNFDGAGGTGSVGEGSIAGRVQNEPRKCPDATDSTQHPVSISSGNKTKSEVDFLLHSSDVPLGIARSYNKLLTGAGAFGARWSSNIEYTLTFHYGTTIQCAGRLGGTSTCNPLGQTLKKVVAMRSSGYGRTFTQDASGTWNSGDGSTLATNGQNWTITSPTGETETYNASGQAISIADARGVGLTYTYSGGQLQKITHSSGRFIQLTWLSGKIKTVTAPNSKTYTYNYDAAGYLSSVVQPDNLGTRTYHYEDAAQPGGLTGISINGARYSQYSYYPDGRVKHSGLGSTGSFEKSSFAYAADHTDVTNALGQTTRYHTADLAGSKLIIGVDHPASAACPAGSRYTSYDANTNVDYEIDALNVKTDYTYDVNNQLIQKIVGIGPNGETDQQQITQYVWDTGRRGRLLAVKVFGTSTSEKISETAYAYYPDGDPRARLLQSVTVTNRSAHGLAGSAQVTSYAYTLYPNKLVATMTVDGPVSGTGDAVVYVYDAAGNLTSTKNSLNHQVSYAGYTALGRPGQVTNENGAVTSFTYDARGNVLSQVENVNGTTATTTFAYDPSGRVKKTTYPDGTSFDYSYALNDKVSRIATSRPAMLEISADGIITETRTFTYNLFGMPTHVVDEKHWKEIVQICDPICGPIEENPGPGQMVPRSQVTTSRFMDYDPSGFLRARRGNNGQNIRYTYDAIGNVVTITDSLNKVTTLTYDRQRNVIQSKDPLNGVTRFEYDRIGRLTKVVDPRNRTTSYVLDGFGQLWAQTSPDTGTTSFEYNAGGQRTKMTRASSAATSYGYDGLGRLVSVSAGGQVQTFGYDACANGKGRVCKVTDPHGELTYTYNPQGWKLTQGQKIGTSAINFGLTYAYDNSGRLTGISYPGGVSAGYGYANGRLSTMTVTIGGTTHNVARDFSRLPFGPTTGWKYGNGTSRVISHDLDGRPTSIRSNISWNAALQDLAFQYDGNNLISRITHGLDATMSSDYVYDALGRVTKQSRVGNANFHSTWAYDASGNRSSMGGQSGDMMIPPTAHVIDPASNRLQSVGGGSFAYSQNGNTTTNPMGEGATYGYDAFERLNSVTRSGATTTYWTNALGVRTLKVTSGNPDSQRGFVHGPSGQLEVEYAWGDANAARRWTYYLRLPGGEPVAMVRNNLLYMIHTDHLARPEVVSNSAKTVVWRARNSAFGRVVTLDGIGGLNLGFPGQYWDDESGLWYNRFRSYDPSIGRYVESDPIGLEGGINTYSYAAGNPVSKVDPLGLVAYWCKNGNTVGVGIPVYFYGDAATTENISNVVNSVQDAWSRQVGQYNLSVTVIVSTAPYAAGAPGEAIGNNVSMVPGVGRSNAGKLHVPPLRDNSYAHEGGHWMGLGHFPLTLMDGDIANNGITEEMVRTIMSSDENFRAGGCGCE